MRELAPALAASTARRRLWRACRGLERTLDELAQRIESAAGWDDLILPEPQKATLRQIAAHVRHRLKVYDEWGFADKGARGLGHQRAVRGRERHRQDDGGRGARE